MKCLLIVNPRSGKMKIQNELVGIIKLLNEAGYEVQVEITRYHNHARELASKSANFDIVVCSGGDGTLNQVASGLVDADLSTPLGYIPAGSTNDYANTLGLSFDMLEATQNIIDGKKYLLDIGIANTTSYFNYIASFGLFSSVSYSTPQRQKNILGHTAYLLNGLNDLANIKTYHIKGKTLTQAFEGDYLLGFVLNTTSIAGLVKLDPQMVDLSDGLFEVLLVKKPKDMIDRGQLVDGLLNRDYSNPAFTFLKTNKLDLYLDNDTSWSLDGEEVKLGKEVNISILHQRIPLIF